MNQPNVRLRLYREIERENVGEVFVENGALISQVLDASAGRAPDMTHALYSLGNGDMGAGIVTLWKAGQKAGVMKGACATALAFSIGIGVSTMLLSRFYQDRLKEVERNTADACLEFATSIYEQRCGNCAGLPEADVAANSGIEHNATI